MNWLRTAASFRLGALDEGDYGLQMGNIYASMGQAKLAMEQFEKLLVNWPEDKNPKQTQVLAAFKAAQAQFQSNQFAKAKTLLDRALEGAAKLGYDQFLVVAASTDPEFIDYFSGLELSTQARKLFDRARNFEGGKTALETNGPELEIAPIHMEIRAFGLGEIRLNGEILPMSAWRSSRARGLFFYILDKGKVRKEAIGLEFWPEFNSGKVSSNFHATLWRVRQALGFKESIVFENDQYSLHPSMRIWYDVNEFQVYLEKAVKQDLSKRERIEAIKQAIKLYTDPYLQDIYMEWADRRREELRNLYTDALLDLATLEDQSKHYREAKLLYEKILAVDPYRDEVHLALMKCLALSGAPSAAIAHFKRYRSLLHKELNSEPLSELQAYFEELTIKV